MQREEHLVFSEFALTGNVMDGRFTPTKAQKWTYTFVFIDLQNVSVITCLWLDYLFVMPNDTPSYLRLSQTDESSLCFVMAAQISATSMMLHRLWYYYYYISCVDNGFLRTL